MSLVGRVVRATTQYSSQYLDTFPAHQTPVYTVQWNTFITDLFITCAFEFTVKIWHCHSQDPVFRFDLGSQVMMNKMMMMIMMNRSGTWPGPRTPALPSPP